MLEVFFDGDVQPIFESFAACFGVRMAFFSPELQELKAGLERNAHFCTLLQERLQLRARCRQDDAIHAAMSVKDNRLISYVCHAGLTEAIMPVYAGTRLAGYVILGQIRTAKRLPAEVLTVWQQHGGSRRELEDAYAALPYIPPERLRNMLNLFELTVQHLASRQMIAVKQAALVETLREYLRRNIDRPITVAELTAFTGKSASTIARACQQAYGKSLKQVMIELKLEAADRQFREHPETTVAAAAHSLGFADPFYFTRLYKKYRGVTPSARLRQLGVDETSVTPVDDD